MKPVFNRILLKLSGEVLVGKAEHGIDFDTVKDICEVISKCAADGVQFGIVVGGGNFWRGRSSGDMDRTRADHMGMLATVMNSLALQEGFIQCGNNAAVMTALDIQRVAKPFNKDEAVNIMQEGRIVIFACGTGSPYFSTDSGAALRAAETGCDVFFKATNVDGVYDKDPNKYPDAKKYDEISYDEILEKHLGVMDNTAAALAQNNNIPVLVFDLSKPENIRKAVYGENIGTIVK